MIAFILAGAMTILTMGGSPTSETYVIAAAGLIAFGSCGLCLCVSRSRVPARCPAARRSRPRVAAVGEVVLTVDSESPSLLPVEASTVPRAVSPHRTSASGLTDGGDVRPEASIADVQRLRLF